MRKRWLEVIHRLALKNERIVFVGSDLSADPALKKAQADLKERFYMEGVSEAHIIGMCSGLAVSGKIVFFNTIATFITRRCFEQNAIDLGLTNANVRLLGSGGGLVYAPLGPTHLAIDDLALMRAIPNMAVIAPCDADEMERAVEASIAHQGPIYFRVAKGGDPVLSKPENGFKIGKAIALREAKGPDGALIVSTGVVTGAALAAADELTEQGIPTTVLHAHTVKPLDTEAVASRAAHARVVLTMEEHVLSGGLGSAVAEVLAEARLSKPVRFKRLALPDYYPDEYGSQDSLLAQYGVSKDAAVKAARELLG